MRDVHPDRMVRQPLSADEPKRTTTEKITRLRADDLSSMKQGPPNSKDNTIGCGLLCAKPGDYADITVNASHPLSVQVGRVKKHRGRRLTRFSEELLTGDRALAATRSEAKLLRMHSQIVRSRFEVSALHPWLSLNQNASLAASTRRILGLGLKSQPEMHSLEPGSDGSNVDASSNDAKSLHRHLQMVRDRWGSVADMDGGGELEEWVEEVKRRSLLATEMLVTNAHGINKVWQEGITGADVKVGAFASVLFASFKHNMCIRY